MNNHPEEAKRIFKWAAAVLMVLAVFLSVQTLLALKKFKVVEPANNTISVDGEGEAFAVPDIATLSFSVSAEAKEVSAAQAEVTAKMNAILAELKAAGIEERDIRTTDYSVYPKYVFETSICNPTFCPPRDQVQDGYTARHSVSVKVRKTEDAGRILALIGEKGATDLSGVSFTVDDSDAITSAARAEAIEDARQKAKVLAKALGVKLVRVVSFYDNGGYAPYYGEMSMGGDAVRTSDAAPAPQVPLGENKTQVNVTVVYEIR